jgi:hypothetical protein
LNLLRTSCALAALAALVEIAAAAPFAGNVLDGQTLQPIAGAVVTAPDGSTQVADKVGRFGFADLPAGPQELVVTADGYEPTTELVELAEGGELDHVFILFTPGAAAEIIEVVEELPNPPTPGRQTLARREISKIPGSRGDALTAVRSLPGVGSQPAAGAGPGQVVIRGSAPEESRVTIDGIEIPILYHFFGVQSVLPTEFIETIEFLPGGFGVEEGRATGGVINVVTRAEAITEAEGFAELSFINLAGFFQAPLSQRRGLQISGALRRSLIDLVLPAVIPDSANLAFTTAPQYYDGQLRLDWRRSERERLSLLALGSYDLLRLLNDNVDPNEPDFRGAFDSETQFTRLIGTWARRGDGWSNRLVLAAGTSGFRLEIGDQFLRFGLWAAEFRDDARWEASERLTVRAGASAKYDDRTIGTRFPQAPAEGQPPPGNFSTLPLVELDRDASNSVSAAYVATDLEPVESTTVTAGIRLDHYYFIDESTLTPRVQLTHRFDRRWTGRLAMGAYSRGLEQNESLAPQLKPELAYHYVAGATWEPRDGISVEASAFYSDKRQLVTADPLAAQVDPANPYVNRAYGRSYGAEVLARARFADFFGWLAYSYNRSDRIDGPQTAQRLFDFDQTHNLVALGSYTLGKWQFGGRFQYATGTPVTPVTGSVYLSDVNAFIPEFGAVNSDRLEAQHQLDVRIDRVWRFADWKLSAYLDVTNVYAHARVLGYQYNYDFTERQAITDLPFVPAIGLRGEM